MPISFGLNPVFLLLCLLAAGTLAWWSYRVTVPALSLPMRAGLGTMRFAALSIVLVLLFEPVWQRIATTEKAPVLAVLVDDTQSVGRTIETGEGMNVAAAVRDAVNRLPRRMQGADIQFFRFAGGVDVMASGTADLSLDGGRTDISAALSEVRRRLSDRNLAAVVLISDGLYNTGRNPVYVAEEYPAPIFTVLVGDTTDQRDVSIRRITTNELAYSGRQTPVQVAIRSVGFAGARTTVSLRVGDGVVATEEVTLPEGTTDTIVDLYFTPQRPGLERVTVEVSQLPGEITYENNVARAAVRVVESKRRVLLLGGAPGPDLAALRQVLASDSDVELTARIQRPGGQFYEGPIPTDFSGFDVIVMADYPATGANPALVRRIADAVRGGKPLLYVAGLQTDLDLLTEHFGGLLPATPRRARSSLIEAQPLIAGGDAPGLGAISLPDAIRRLPPLSVMEGLWQAAPGARVLARQQIRGLEISDPLIAIRRQGRQRSAAVLGAGTWRWKNLPEDMDSYVDAWPGLLMNMVQWIATSDDDRPVRVRPVTGLFGGDEPVLFTGEVYDERLEPINDASINLEIIAPDDNRFPHPMRSIGNGRYTLEAGVLPEGTYRYEASADLDGRPLGTDRGSFEVGALDLEHRETRADADLMRQIALRSGGEVLEGDAVSGFGARLAALPGFTPEILSETESRPLWHMWSLLVLVIALLSVEWFFRKRSGLL